MTKMLEDLDFANEIALLSHRHRDMQGKQTILQIQQKKVEPEYQQRQNQSNEDQRTIGRTHHIRRYRY